MCPSDLAGLCVASVHSVMRNGIPRSFVDNSKPRFSDCLVLVLDGCCVYRFKTGEMFTAKKDDLFYLPCGSSYTMDVGEAYRVLYVNFYFDVPQMPFCVSTKRRPNVRMHFERLYAVHIAKMKAYETERLGVLYQLLAETARMDADAYMSPQSRELTEKIYAYIGERLDDPTLNVDDIARHFSIGNEYLRKLFRTSNGVPPIRYITSLRLEKAAALLREYPKMSVKEAAVRCGYDDPCYFSRVFKSHYGLPPKEMKPASR